MFMLAMAGGDIVFFVLAASVFSIYLYHAASGEFRWFYLAGSVLGFLLYYFTIGRVVMFFSEIIAFALRVCVRYAIWVAVLPLRVLLWLCKRTVCEVHKRIAVPVRVYFRHRRYVRYTAYMKKKLPSDIRFLEERS